MVSSLWMCFHHLVSDSNGYMSESVLLMKLQKTCLKKKKELPVLTCFVAHDKCTLLPTANLFCTGDVFACSLRIQATHFSQKREIKGQIDVLGIFQTQVMHV